MGSPTLLLSLVSLCLCGGAALPEEPAARPDRPWVGAIFGPALDWNMNPMLMVKKVLPGSPADEAGLTEGDFVRALNGSAMRDLTTLSVALDKSSGGDVLVLTIARGAEVIAVPVTLAVPTDEQRADLAARLATLAAVPEDPDAPHMVFLPQRLCLTGVTYNEALAMSLVPGAVSMNVNEIGSCRHPVDACAPVMLMKQSKNKTIVERMGIRYKMKGDWRAITHQAREQCLAALSRQP